MAEADDTVREMGRAVTDAVDDAADKATEAARGTAEKVSDATSHAVGAATSAVTDAIDATRQDVVAGVHQATERVGEFGDRAIATVKHHPTRTVLLVAACAVLAGFVIGAVTAKRG